MVDSFIIILEIELVLIIRVHLTNGVSFLVIILLIVVFILADDVFLIIFVVFRAILLIFFLVFTVAFIITFWALEVLHVLLHLYKISNLILIHFDFTATVQIIHNLLLVFVDEKWLFRHLLKLLLAQVVLDWLMAENIFFTVLSLFGFWVLGSLILILSPPLPSLASLFFRLPIFTNWHVFIRLLYPLTYGLRWSNALRTLEAITHGLHRCSILIILALSGYLTFLNIKLALDELALLVHKRLLYICVSHRRTESLCKIIDQHLILLLKLLLEHFLLFLLLLGKFFLSLVPNFRFRWVAELLKVFINCQISLFKGRSKILERFCDCRAFIFLVALCSLLTGLLLDDTGLARSVHDLKITAIYDTLDDIIVLRGRIIKLICSRTFLLWLCRWIFHLNMYLIFR